MIDAEKVELARVLLVAEGGIGEVDLAVFSHHDIVGGVEALALIFFGDNFDFALLVGARDAAQVALAGVQATLRIERISVCAVGIRPQDANGHARFEPEDFIVGNIAKNQVAVARPGRTLGEDVAGGDFVHLDLGEILRGGGEREEQEGEDGFHVTDQGSRRRAFRKNEAKFGRVV